MKKTLKAFDDLFINLINNKMKNKYLDIFMYRVTDLGGAIFSTLFAFVLLAFGNTRIKLIAVEALVVLFISQIIVQSLKKILSRERPYVIIEKLNTFGISLSDYSFPSGHTTASFSIATTLALNIPFLAYFVFIMAAIIGISRIYLGVHYPTDVAAGIILGIGSSFLVHYYLLNVVNYLGAIIGIR